MTAGSPNKLQSMKSVNNDHQRNVALLADRADGQIMCAINKEKLIRTEVLLGARTAMVIK